jgi:hypothetical protein
VIEGKGQTRNWLIIAPLSAGKRLVGNTNMKKLVDCDNIINDSDDFFVIFAKPKITHDKPRGFSKVMVKEQKLSDAA